MVFKNVDLLNSIKIESSPVLLKTHRGILRLEAKIIRMILLNETEEVKCKKFIDTFYLCHILKISDNFSMTLKNECFS